MNNAMNNTLMMRINDAYLNIICICDADLYTVGYKVGVLKHKVLMFHFLLIVIQILILCMSTRSMYYVYYKMQCHC